jgi:sucrose-6-phosphatase
MEGLTLKTDGKYLICSDLDRTILPNGAAEESPRGRPLLRKLAEIEGLVLAYVSGRNLRLLKAAVAEYELPLPRYAVGDVGTTIYDCRGGDWRIVDEWGDTIAADWPRGGAREIAALLDGVAGLEPQEEEKQNRFKLSFYAPPDFARSGGLRAARERLAGLYAQLELIWSIDENGPRGLLDILPSCATKLGAVEFLIERSGVPKERTVFAGDSGNDLPVLSSSINAVLVANASEQVKRQARGARTGAGLHIAQGGFHGLNGNYAAGVIEGVCHFMPELEELLFD